MSELAQTAKTLRDLDRLSEFFVKSNPQAAQEAFALIFEALEVLELHPEMGCKVHFGQRELVISRGNTGCLAL